jgi:hypothetical protein
MVCCCVLCGRYEILLIAYRKSEWDWSQEVARASSSLDNATGSFVPVPPAAPPPHDPERMLFSMQWIEMAFAGGGGGGPGRGGGREYGRGGRGRGGRGDGGDSMGRGAPGGRGQSMQQHAPPQQPADYYGGDLNGFVIDGTPEFMDESMARCGSFFLSLPAVCLRVCLWLLVCPVAEGRLGFRVAPW